MRLLPVVTERSTENSATWRIGSVRHRRPTASSTPAGHAGISLSRIRPAVAPCDAQGEAGPTIEGRRRRRRLQRKIGSRGRADGKHEYARTGHCSPNHSRAPQRLALLMDRSWSGSSKRRAATQFFMVWRAGRGQRTALICLEFPHDEAVRFLALEQPRNEPIVAGHRLSTSRARAASGHSRRFCDVRAMSG